MHHHSSQWQIQTVSGDIISSNNTAGDLRIFQLVSPTASIQVWLRYTMNHPNAMLTPIFQANISTLTLVTSTAGPDIKPFRD